MKSPHTLIAITGVLLITPMTLAGDPCANPDAGCCNQEQETGGCYSISDPGCCEMICDYDPFCCEAEWDGSCAFEATIQCELDPIVDGCTPFPNECGPGTGDCCTPNLSPGCDDEECCTMICTADLFCCDIEWDSICANTALVTCSLDICHDPDEAPANDDCGNAAPIAEGDTTFSNVGATNDGPALPGSCDEGFGVAFGADIWYSYEPTRTGTLTVSTCGTVDYDTRLAAYTGDCADLQFAACNDDGPGCSGGASILEVPVTCGVPVLVRVGGFAGAEGSGTVNVSVAGSSCDGGCEGDTNGDGTVGVLDLIDVISYWTTDGQGPGIDADLDDDGIVGVLDLILLISNWGDCP